MSTWSPGVIDFSGVKTSEENRSSFSLTDEPSIQIDLIIKPDFKIELEKDSTLNFPSSSVESFDEPKMQGRPSAGIMPTVPPASVPPHFHDKTKSTSRAFSGIDAV
jgi:hypothetical protein